MQTLIPEVLKATLRSYGDLPAAVRGPHNRRVIQALCVFCGSNAGRRPVYSEAARAMGELLAGRGITLVYGGEKVGLMGVVANACLTAGGKVIGVIPRLLQEKELAHQGLTEMHVVGTMHERKAMMANLADGFLALPGGFGTWDEFCEVFTWSQLGIQSKAWRC